MMGSLAAGARHGCSRTGRGMLLWLVLLSLAAAAWAADASAAQSENGSRPPGALQLAWRADLGRSLGSRLSVQAGGVAVTTFERRYALLDRASGARIWQGKASSGIQDGLAAIPGGWLGVTDPPGSELLCLDGESGDVRWRRETGGAFAAPLVAGEACFTASLAGRVSAWSVASGELRWERNAPGPVRCSLALVDSLLLIPTLTDSLVAWSVADGAFRWGCAPRGALYAPPVAVADRLYALSYTGWVTAIDARSGAIMAARQLPGLYRAGLAGPELLVALSTSGHVCALDPADLAILWERELGHVGEWTPALWAGTAWIGLRDGTVVGLDVSDGSVHYQLRVPAPVSAPIVVDAEYLLISGGRGEVVAYRWVSDAGELSRPARSSGSPALRAWTDTDLPGVAWVGPARSVGAGSAGAGALPIGWASERPGCEMTRLPSTLAERTLCGANADVRSGGLARWRWIATAGWVGCAALALWLQDRADAAYEDYRRTGEPGGREDAYARAKDFDRAVVGAWVLSEGCFAVGVKAWLDARGHEVRP